MDNQTILRQRSLFATASFIFGLISLFPPLSFYTGPAAIILAILALWQIKKKNLMGSRFAYWGIFLSVAGMIISGIILTYISFSFRDL